MNDYEEEEFDELEDELETKAARKRRLARRREDSREMTRERPLRPFRRSRPRPRCLHYDPEYDEDDYDEMFE